MNEKTRNLAVSGLAVALNIVLMVLSSYIQINTLAFLFLTSVLSAIVLLEANKRYAVICFVATSILSAVLVPDKQMIFYYILFFGWYPLLKLLAESRKSRVVEWIIKLVIFHSILAIGGMLFYWLFHINLLASGFSIWLIWPASVTIFVLLDILLSFGIYFYLRKRKK